MRWQCRDSFFFITTPGSTENTTQRGVAARVSTWQSPRCLCSISQVDAKFRCLPVPLGDAVGCCHVQRQMLLRATRCDVYWDREVGLRNVSPAQNVLVLKLRRALRGSRHSCRLMTGLAHRTFRRLTTEHWSRSRCARHRDAQDRRPAAVVAMHWSLKSSATGVVSEVRFVPRKETGGHNDRRATTNHLFTWR